MKFFNSIQRTMDNPDDFVLEIEYLDQKNKITRRTISPTSWLSGKKTFRALCLGREALRTFIVSRIQALRVVDANDVLAPVAISSSGAMCENIFEAIDSRQPGQGGTCDNIFAPPNKGEPVDGLPGSSEKLSALAERVEKGEPLWHENDRLHYSEDDS